MYCFASRRDVSPTDVRHVRTGRRAVRGGPEEELCVKRKSAFDVRERTRKLVYVALFAALTAVLSQISIPLPSGVPLTLQTFAVAFAGFFLGWKYGLAAIGVYVALGACGAPVFAGFTGGAYKLIGVTGGFIWGFFPLVALVGTGGADLRRPSSAMLALAGLAVCHMIGIGQYALVTGNPLGASALAVSVPYIAKDALSVLLAAIVARAVSRRAASPFAATDNAALLRKIKHIS